MDQLARQWDQDSQCRSEPMHVPFARVVYESETERYVARVRDGGEAVFKHPVRNGPEGDTSNQGTGNEDEQQRLSPSGPEDWLEPVMARPRRTGCRTAGGRSSGWLQVREYGQCEWGVFWRLPRGTGSKLIALAMGDRADDVGLLDRQLAENVAANEETAPLARSLRGDRRHHSGVRRGPVDRSFRLGSGGRGSAPPPDRGPRRAHARLVPHLRHRSAARNGRWPGAVGRADRLDAPVYQPAADGMDAGAARLAAAGGELPDMDDRQPGRFRRSRVADRSRRPILQGHRNPRLARHLPRPLPVLGRADRGGDPRHRRGCLLAARA